jgi:hypothetical protein
MCGTSPRYFVRREALFAGRRNYATEYRMLLMKSGDWAIGGQTLTTGEVHAMAGTKAA